MNKCVKSPAAFLAQSRCVASVNFLAPPTQNHTGGSFFLNLFPTPGVDEELAVAPTAPQRAREVERRGSCLLEWSAQWVLEDSVF